MELFEVDKSTFDRLLAEDMRAPDFGHTMQALLELRELPVFHGLDSDQLNDLLEHGSDHLGPGDEIDAGSGWRSVLRDRVRTRGRGRRTARVIGQVSKGMYFGETWQFGDVPRTATVVATSPMRLFGLDRDGFELVVADAFRRGTLRPAADRVWRH